jgi:hypothetical protein
MATKKTPKTPSARTPKSSAPKGKRPEPAPGGAEAKDKKLSALDAAAKLLAETGQPMTCQAMIEGMAAKCYWTSPGGKTPQATLYSSIVREIKNKGTKARFKKTDRGQFAHT